MFCKTFSLILLSSFVLFGRGTSPIRNEQDPEVGASSSPSSPAEVNKSAPVSPSNDVNFMDTDSPSQDDTMKMKTVNEPSSSAGTSSSTLSIHALSGKAHEHFRDGKYEEAIRYYSMTLEKDDEATKYYRNRGLCYTKIGDYNLAVLDFQKAVEMEPHNVRGRYYLGSAFLETGEHVQAVEHLEKAFNFAKAEQVLEDDLNQIVDLLERARERTQTMEHETEEVLDIEKRKRSELNAPIVGGFKKRQKQKAAFPVKNSDLKNFEPSGQSPI